MESTNQVLREGVKAHKEGKLEDAERLYRAVLESQPKHPDANHNLGVLLSSINNVGAALPVFKAAIESNAHVEQFWLSYINALIHNKQFHNANQAIAQATANGISSLKLKKLIAKPPLSKIKRSKAVPSSLQDQLDCLTNHFKNDRLSEAERLAVRITECFPENELGWNIFGQILAKTGRLQPAASALRKAAELSPRDARSHNNLGLVLAELDRPEEAELIFKQAIALNANLFEAHYNLANVLKGLLRLEEAAASLKKAIKVMPCNPKALNNLGVIFQELGNFEGSVTCFNDAIDLQPDLEEVHNNLAISFYYLGRLRESEASSRKSLSIKPDYLPALRNLSLVLVRTNRLEDAEEICKTVLEMEPNCAKGYSDLAYLMEATGRLDLASAYYKKSLQLDSGDEDTVCDAYSVAMLISDWDHGGSLKKKILQKAFDSGSSLYSLLVVSDDPEMHLRRAKRKARLRCVREPISSHKEKMNPRRLKIAYLSNCFGRQHPISMSLARTIELHDRDQFEVYAFHYGCEQGDAYNLRMRKAFDHFIDISKLSDREAAELIYAKGINIAIELSGYLEENRVGILAHRPSPIQINFLGHPGSMGATHLDYVISDHSVLTRDQAPSYTEKVIRLPDCYLPIDDTRKVASNPSARVEHGLPENGFVFCDFNNSFKITNQEFDIWMRLLAEVKESVFWLMESNEWSKRNLKFEAVKRGISADRLVFAKNLPINAHLARLKHADLVLDTFNFNAHGTAVDALWVGVPVLTKMGKSFTSRLAGGLLKALDIPELITHSEHEYESLALNLAKDPHMLNTYKTKINRNKSLAALFKSAKYTRYLESAFNKAYNHYLSGSEPISFDV